MSLINVINVTFGYEESYEDVFENVSFQIDTDWKLGFIGRNGRGKTTFLNLLLGKYEYKGKISASVSFEYFPYVVEDKGQLTKKVIEHIYAGYEEWKIVKELSLLQVKEEVLYRPFHTLSQGEQTKVLLAALFLKENQFLLIDEPTNHLDKEARKVVGAYLNSKKGFILVSHDRAFMDDCVDHILSINKQNIEIQKGNFSSWYANKERQDEFEREQNSKLSKDIKRLEAAAKRSEKWSDTAEKRKIGFDPTRVEKSISRRPKEGAKAKKAMKRAKAFEQRQNDAINEKKGLLQNIESQDCLELRPLKYHTDILLELKDVSVFYDKKEICDNINFRIAQGEQVLLAGRNGCGKSSILKLICGEKLCGERISYTGEVRIGSQLKISYMSQDTSKLHGTLEAYAAAYGVEITLLKTLLRKLDLERSQFDKEISSYSEGQKKKVLIARSLCERAHLYVWDEPLNYIDVISRMQIENLLLQYRPTLLFVEHDTAFAEKIAGKEIRM